jgi:F-type H+-transporting ATPase subunit a
MCDYFCRAFEDHTCMKNSSNKLKISELLRNSAGIFILLFMMVSVRVAASGGHEDGEEKFNASKTIIEHIADAHSIHFFGHASLPLPCIVKTKEGFDFFMSSVFMDEHHAPTKIHKSTRTGNSYVMIEEQIRVLSAEEAAHWGEPIVETHAATLDTLHAAEEGAQALETAPAPTEEKAHEKPGHAVVDFSLTKSVVGMMFILGLVAFLFIRVASAYRKRAGMAPKGMQNFLEPLILFIKDEVAIPALGQKRAKKFLPFLLTAFFFIWACNILGLVPFLGGFNITGTLSITLVLATLVFIITSVNGNAHYWGHIVWPPGVPLPIKFILVPIEIVSVFIKPAVLMIRLTANINAGHIIILSFTSLIFIFKEMYGAGAACGIGVFSTLFMIFMFLIELLVAFLQAYVFTLLAALYFGDATQEHHHEEAAHH